MQVLEAALDRVGWQCQGPGFTKHDLNSKQGMRSGQGHLTGHTDSAPRGGLQPEEAQGRVFYSTGISAGSPLCLRWQGH